MNTTNFEKTSLFVEEDYEQQTSTHLSIVRVIFVRHIHFKKLMKFQKCIEIFHDEAQEQEIRFLLIILIDKNHSKKEKYGTEFVSETVKISKFR